MESSNGHADTTIKKIDSTHSPKGKLGQRYLASGSTVAMRLWQAEKPGELGEAHTRPYETIGYVIDGKAELHAEGQVVTLAPGDSWVVPKDSHHAYKIIESFTAVEATHPPAHVDGRDQ